MHSRDFHFLNDYPDVFEWWNKWKWNPVPPEFLPPTGIMIENNNKKICCCWIYRTDTVLCIIDYFVINPFTTREERKGCIDFLMKEALKKAKKIGFGVAITFTDHANLLKMLENNGYVKQTDLSKMIRGL